MLLSGFSVPHAMQGYLVYPFCWPRRKHTMLRSTQMMQLCSWHCHNSMPLFTCMSPYSSRSETEWPIGTASYKLPLFRKTHYKLRWMMHWTYSWLKTRVLYFTFVFLLYPLVTVQPLQSAQCSFGSTKLSHVQVVHIRKLSTHCLQTLWGDNDLSLSLSFILKYAK